MTQTEIERATALLRAGELVAFPTETVYGLGADARNTVAVAKIFAAKGRPADHPLIVHLPDAEHLTAWASDIPRDAIALGRVFWPGPLTLILKREQGVPDAVTGGQDTVGLRVPNHPLALALLKTFGSGIAAPSANRFGRISPTTAAHVHEELGERVALILDGGTCTVGIESTILDLSRGEPVLLRPGAISAAEIAAVIGRLPQALDSTTRETAPRASGTLAAHYAPRTPLRLIETSQLTNEVCATLASGMSVAVLAWQPSLRSETRLAWVSAANDPAQYAHDLYANLRRLDNIGANTIVIEAPPATAEWLAVNDRLSRAAYGSGENDMVSDET